MSEREHIKIDFPVEVDWYVGDDNADAVVGLRATAYFGPIEVDRWFYFATDDPEEYQIEDAKGVLKTELRKYLWDAVMYYGDRVHPGPRDTGDA